jgi:hypothetical protein
LLSRYLPQLVLFLLVLPLLAAAAALYLAAAKYNNKVTGIREMVRYKSVSDNERPCCYYSIITSHSRISSWISCLIAPSSTLVLFAAGAGGAAVLRLVARGEL